MKNMRVQSVAENVLQWTLNAARAEGFTTRNFLRAIDMRVQLFENGAKSSDITANEGIVATDNTAPVTVRGFSEGFTGHSFKKGDMFMDGDVVVVSTEGSKLTTDWIYYDKTTDLITSTAPVQIVRSDSITRGQGLEASADLTKVKIFKQTLVIPGGPDEK
jgi:lipopolysaccharide export system protein LptC